MFNISEIIYNVKKSIPMCKKKKNRLSCGHYWKWENFKTKYEKIHIIEN